MGLTKTLAGCMQRLAMLGLVSLASMLFAGIAVAQTRNPERNGNWLRSYAGPYDRQAAMRGGQNLADTQERHPESDEVRQSRRWSPEERRQLRHDIHEAARDVYGPTVVESKR